MLRKKESYPNLLNTVVNRVPTMPTVYHLKPPHISLTGSKPIVYSLREVVPIYMH